MFVTKSATLLTFLLLAGSFHFLQAQPGYWNPLSPSAPPPQQARAFKVGDYVEGRFAGQWIPCQVKDLQLYGAGGRCAPLSATCSTVGAYIVTCVAIAPNGAEDFTMSLGDVRARAATPEDKRVAAETSAALARQPRGNSLGAKYGTREPRTCASRTVPAHGAPSAEQARQYVICELERGDGANPLSLVTNVKVQVASVSHEPNQFTKEITSARIDPREPIWDIRGSFTSYLCKSLGSLTASNDIARTHNCSVSDHPNAVGYCYKDTFGDWHCGMLGGATNERSNVLPPAGY
jgi:hypothetical protein